MASAFQSDAFQNDAFQASVTFTADAFIQPYFTADAVITTTQSASFTADAYIVATIAGSFSANAYIQPYFLADAVIHATQSASFTADATFPTAFTFSADAVVFYETTETSFSADAIIFVVVLATDFPYFGDLSVVDPRFVLTSGVEAQEFFNQLILDYDQINMESQAAQYGRYPMSGAHSIIQIDFRTPNDNTDTSFGWEINLAASQEADGLWYWGYLGTFLNGANGADTDVTFYTGAITYDVVLLPNTLYSVKALVGNADIPDQLKFWDQDDPEPSGWQISGQSVGFASEPSPSFYQWYMNSAEADNITFENLAITSIRAGFSYGYGSFTANAVIKATIEFSTIASSTPTVRAATSANASGASVDFLAIDGQAVGDFAVVVGLVSGNVTTQLGGVRGVLSDTLFTLAARVNYASLGHTFGVWYTHVGGDSFGGFPTITWEWSGGTNSRIGALFLIDDSGGIVRSVTSYEDVTVTDTQTIPLGTADILLDGSLALPAFGATAAGLTAFDVPINAVEWVDRTLTIISTTRMALEVSATTGLAAGDSPAWTANSIGANVATRAIVVDIPPRSGIVANAFLKGTVIFADAALTTAPGAVYPILFEDDFDDRFATAGWGGIWQALPGQGAALSVDGAQALATASTTRQALTNYPAVPPFSSYELDVLFTTRSATNRISLETTSAAGTSTSFALDGTGVMLLNAASGSLTLTANQWYSVLLDFRPDRTDVYVWLRGTTQPGSATISGANVTSSFFVPRLYVDGSTQTLIDNVVVRTLATSWKRFGVCGADAIKLATVTESRHEPFPTFLTQHAFSAEAVISRTFTADAYLRTSVHNASFVLDAVILAATSLRADAYFVEDIRMRHERDGPEHLGVDYESVHTLAASIGIYPQGMDLRDVLIAIDERLEALEAQ